MSNSRAKMNPELLSTCKQVFEEVVRNLPRHQQTESVKSRIAAHILRVAADGETDRRRLREVAQLDAVLTRVAHRPMAAEQR